MVWEDVVHDSGDRAGYHVGNLWHSGIVMLTLLILGNEREKKVPGSHHF